jgi:hypothetical protein
MKVVEGGAEGVAEGAPVLLFDEHLVQISRDCRVQGVGCRV